MSSRRPIKITVVRESLDVKIGVSLRQEEDKHDDKKPIILINTIASDSLFANTRIQPGMQVLKINTVSLVNTNNNENENEESVNLQTAMQLLKESQDVVTLEACDYCDSSHDDQDDHSNERQEQQATSSSTTSSPNASTSQIPPPVTPSPPHSPNPPRPSSSSSLLLNSSSSLPSLPVPVHVIPLRDHQRHPHDNPNSHTNNEDAPVAVASTVEDEPSSPRPEPLVHGLPVASAELLEEEEHDDDHADTTTRDNPQNNSNNNRRVDDDDCCCVATLLTPTTIPSRIVRNVLDVNGIVTVTATKPSPTAAIGISLKKQPPHPQSQTNNIGGVWISCFKSFSIFQGTHLQPGMKILRINGQDTHEVSPEEAGQLFKRCPIGEITVVARFVSPHISRNDMEYEPRNNHHTTTTTTTTTTNDTDHGNRRVVTVTATKPSPLVKAGVRLRQPKKGGAILIVNLHSDSLFCGSHLEAGMRLMSINGLEVDKTSVEYCSMLLRSIDKDVTLVARDVGEEDEEEAANNINNNVDEATEESAQAATDETISNGSGSIADDEATVEDAGNDLTHSETEAAEVAAENPSNDDDSTHSAVDAGSDSALSEDTLVNECDDSNQCETEKTDKDRSEDTGRAPLDSEAAVQGKDVSDGKARLNSETEIGGKDDSNYKTPTEAMPQDDGHDMAGVKEMEKIAPKYREAPASLGFSLAAAVINKPDPTSELGIMVGEKTLLDGSQIPVIIEITPDGLCADTDLEVGMRLLSVNGTGCCGADDATSLLREAQGDTVTILASLSWHMALATVNKTTKDAKVGLTMRRIGSMFVIKNLPSDGLFAKSGVLKEGMRICCINGTDVDDMNEAQLGQLVSNAEGTVTVLAEDLNHCLGGD